MLHLFSLVLKRADDLKSRCFSASQVHKILYLIGMGLVGEQRLKEADPETQFQYSERAEKAELLQSMETLTGSYRIESQRAFGMDHQIVQEGSGAGGKEGSQ